MRIFYTLLLSLFITTASFADERVTLQWDPNSPPPDYYTLYQRVEGQSYDYANPLPNPPDSPNGEIFHPTTTFVVTLPTPAPAPQAPVIVNGSYNRSTSEVDLSWTQSDRPESVRYYWVARANIGSDQSGDSNEVHHDVTGTSQVAYWEVFFSLTSGGPWTSLDVVQNTGQPSPTITAPLTVVNSGERVNVFFTVVAFHSTTLFSPNSAEVQVDVDRRIVTPPVLTISTVIPVQ